MKLFNATFIILLLILAGTQLIKLKEARQMLVGESGQQVFSDGSEDETYNPDMAGTQLVRGGLNRMPLISGDAQSSTETITYPTQAEIGEWKRRAALWEEHGWRAEVHLVVSHINPVGPDTGWRTLRLTPSGLMTPNEYLAHAFVRTARELKILLWIAVAIAEKETKFDHSVIGKQHEQTLMQINPMTPARRDAIRDGLADPAKAIKWAMTNCFMPGYNRALNVKGLHDGTKRDQFAIGAGLVYYNGPAYADEVLAMGAKMVKEDELWGLVPQ